MRLSEIMNRRHLLTQTGLGMGGLGLASLLNDANPLCMASRAAEVTPSDGPQQIRVPHFVLA